MAPPFHNRVLERLFEPEAYSLEQIEDIRQHLADHGTFDFTPLPSGLYPASATATPGASGYGNVWVRDNVYVALVLWESGRADDAARVAAGLLSFYGKYQHRFAPANIADVMSRPHVRFDGTTLQEIAEQSWSHAQNDALGYCLWLCARLAGAGVLELDRGQCDTLARLAIYLAAVPYWEDEDSGHWEETRKISASSIGVVVSGFESWLALLRGQPFGEAGGLSQAALIASAEEAIANGRRVLDATLPFECRQPSPRQHRRYDAALLFLLYPLNVVSGTMAGQILADVREHLQGDVGIRRYPGDSYWAPDYDRKVGELDRARDYSNDIETRDALLEKPGDEAQWCIFDPLMSACYGSRFLASGNPEDKAAQHEYFNRALAQITADWRCPELYYWSRGELTPNPHTPLLWTQANLLLALSAMRATSEGRA